MSYSTSSNPKSYPIASPTPLLLSSYQRVKPMSGVDRAEVNTPLAVEIKSPSSIATASLSAQESTLDKEVLLPFSVTPVPLLANETISRALQESATTLPLTTPVKVPLATLQKTAQTNATALKANASEANKEPYLVRAPSQLPVLKFKL